MKTFTKIVISILLTYSFSFSQISLTGSGTYTEDFNTLANTGTLNTIVPLG